MSSVRDDTWASGAHRSFDAVRDWHQSRSIAFMLSETGINFPISDISDHRSYMSCCQRLAQRRGIRNTRLMTRESCRNLGSASRNQPTDHHHVPTVQFRRFRFLPLLFLFLYLLLHILLLILWHCLPFLFSSSSYPSSHSSSSFPVSKGSFTLMGTSAGPEVFNGLARVIGYMHSLFSIGDV